MPDSPAAAQRPGSDGRRISAAEFDFVHHGPLLRRFDKTYDHLRLHDGLPGVHAFDEVHYTPARLLPGGGEQGALFDRTGVRIPASVLRRGRNQSTASVEPLQRATGADLPSDGQCYLYLGWFRPHFGHFITETVSRFWALRHREPGLRLLVHIPVPAMLGWSYVQDVLAGFGLTSDDIEYFDAPRTLGRVLVADPALSLESHAFTGLSEALAPLVSHSLGGGVAPRSEPLYFSRAKLKKGVYRYKGEEQLEDRLRARGVRILHPETMTVPEQIRAVNAHAHILGIIGSAMHNVMFARTPRRLTYLTPRWVNPTCLLLDRCFDAQSRYVQVCDRSDMLHAGWSRVRKRLPLLPPPTRKDRFHYARHLDMGLIDRWLAQADL